MISLSDKKGNNLRTCVDAMYVPGIVQWDWYVNLPGYVARRQTVNKKQIEISLHRYILSKDTEIPIGFFVDHINGNVLDNRRNNLRICTPQENTLNRKHRSNSASGYKGVSLSTKSHARPWVASIGFNGKRTYLGSYVTPQEAAVAYDKAAAELHGEFARLNFPN